MYRSLKCISWLFALVLVAVIAIVLTYLNNAWPPVPAENIPNHTRTTQSNSPTSTPPPAASITPSPPATQTALMLTNAPPTEAITPLPTRPPADQNNTFLESLPNGATRFTDLSGGYTLTFATGWAIIRINQEEFTQLALNQALNAPALQRFLINLQQRNPNAYRVFAINLEKRQPGNDQITFMEVRLDSQEDLSVDQLRSNYYQFLKNEYKINQRVTNDMARNINNLRYGVVEATLQGRAATGQIVAQYIKTALLTPYSRQQLRISLVATRIFPVRYSGCHQPGG